MHGIRKYIVFVLAVLSLVLYSAAGCGPVEPTQVPPTSSTTPVTNQEPGIRKIEAPEEAAPSSEIALSCLALDPDGDVLTYSWEASGGEVSGQGAEVKWVSAAAAGDYIIECAVTDGKSPAISKSVSIRVVEKPGQPPVISKLIFTKDDNIPIEIIPGQQMPNIIVAKWRTSRIECIAEHPDGKTLSYLWAANIGVIEGEGPSVKYITSGITGDAAVIVTVIDSGGAKAQATITVNVPCCGEGAFGQSGT